jgi:hypothetical protein
LRIASVTGVAGTEAAEPVGLEAEGCAVFGVVKRNIGWRDASGTEPDIPPDMVNELRTDAESR